MEDWLRTALSDLANGKASVDDVVAKLRAAPYEDLGFARVDHHRPLVQGMAEVIFGASKTPDQIAAISRSLLERGTNVLVTRASTEAFRAVHAIAPDAVHHESARVISVQRVQPKRIGSVALLAAGTSDLPVVEEADVCARAWGLDTERFIDVGVAGLHRFLAVRDRVDAHDVVIVVAGMEGALASVAGGLLSKPVIAVPTSVGYGASFGGVAALLSMLNACSSGVVVVNIDNGFGAAAAARRLLQRR